MDPGILIDEREDIQKKTFTKWINSHLIKSQCSPVDDLFLDLRDGHRLLALLSVLTGKQLKPEKGRMRVHHINNINKVIQVIQEHGVKLVNISSDDIVGGNPKLILGLIWLIALEFNGQNLVKSQSPNGIEKSLLSWSRQFTEPHGLQLTNFSDCWSDGRAFLMILSANLKGVDLNGALKKHPLARLKTAFDLAYQHYKIEKLLDPEDVHTHKPDNKSIQMYVMCLYHAIEVRKQSGVENDGKNDNENDEVEMIEERCKEDLEPESENEYERGFVPGSSNVTDLDEVPLDNVEEAFTEVLLTSHNLTNDSIQTEKYDNPNIKAYIDYGFDDKSRPLSTATNASVELSSYQVALESVLSLLLEDEQILSRDLPEPEDFMNAKMQFHENENFMLKLTEHQQYVGEALEEGSNLINESQRLNGLTMEDQNEIRQQMVLLNERWETLRLKALDVQSRILMRLASFQTKQLDKLRHFLTNIEDRISHMSTLGPTLADVKDQLDEARGLKEDLHNQQNLVDSLSNMVVIVNDESGNFNDLEDKLAALGERWSHVVKWSEIRLEKLQQYKCITKWLDTREQDLKQMESRDVTDLGSIAKRMNDLNYCAKDLLELQRYLLDLRQMVAATLQEGDDKGEKVLEQLEGFEDRLEALKQIVEVQTERIETKGFKFGRDRASYDYSRVVKPKNWIDFQMMIRFGDDADDDEEADDDSSISHLDEEGSPGKKRKLRNNDNFYSLTNRIMDIFNFLDDCDERLQLLYRQSLRNQNEILSSLESEAMKRSESIENIKLLFEECEKDMPSRNLIMEATHIKQLEERLNNFSKRLIKQKSDLQDLLTKERFYNSLTGFKLVLADSRDWYKQHASSATKDELQQRLSDMESLSSEISNAKQNTISLSNDLQDWKDDFNIFYESWNDMKEAISTLIEEKSESTASSSKQINLRKLENFTFRSNNAQVIVSHLDAMHQQLKLFLNLQEELNSFQPTFSSLKDKQTDSISQEFFENWSNLPDLLNDRIIKQTTAIENLNHFNEEYETILAILLKLERNLKPFESSSNGDENSKSSFSPEQIGSRSSMELRKIEIDVISARNFSEIIIKEALPEHRSHLLDQINQLNELFARVQRLQQQHQQKRAQMLEKIEEILDRLNKTDIWLTSLESNTPKTEISEIKNSNELFQIKSKFQTLKETCEKETNNFRELNDFAGEVLDQIDELKVSGSQEIEAKYLLLRKKLTRLSARWTEVTALVYGKTALLEHISTQLGEFKKYMVSESGYLDRLETKIRATAENADAEEIIEELDDLENILRAHSDEWLEKIQEIGSELIEDEFMVDSIRKEIDTTTDRWLQLQQRAKQKTEILEKEVSEAEQSEKCLTQFEMWLSRVDEILSDHLENDVTIEDLPDDFQRLEHEFEMNEKNFRVIEDLIAEHTRNNKIEAANRLQEQLNLLELRFKSCQQKLNKCTAPQNAYESRLNRAVAELRSVEHSTLVLDVASAGPSSVHSQYQKCLQIYKTLSEIKPEIETTIKTGRKVCDDKYTRSPKQLSQRIDALKHLYNALGENVTQSKIFLETLLKLAQKLEDCFEIAESLIKRFESLEEMHERNSLFLEFEDVLQKCEEIYEEYLKSCDQIYLEETREKIDDLKATYLKLTSADVIKRLTEMKSTLQNLDNISLETLRAMEHDLKEINVPSNPEIKMLQQQVIAIVVYSLEHKFNQRSSITMDKDESPARMNDSKEEVEEDDTEIVIVSDTVRQRRSRTPQANDSFISNDSSQASPVKSSESSSSSKQKKSDDEKHILPDLLLPQTFRLAESSTLFSHISQNPEAAATKALENKTKDLDNKSRNKAQMVEIKETNIQNDKMSVQAVSFEPNQGEIVNTVSILESVEPFIPEYVETVQIVDLSEDSDSSLPVEAKRNGSTNTLNKSKSKSSPCNSPKVQHRTIDTEGAADSNVEMRQPLGNTSTPVLVIERQRISFEEKRKRIETERDILRDSEEENDGPIENKQPRVKRWRQLHLDITPEEDKENSIQKEQLKLDEYLESPLSPISRNSFYNTDSFDVEPLVFSDDEDIPRFSMEATPSFDSDSDTSRIETPSAKRPNTLLHKILSSSPSLDDSNITLKSPLSEIIPNIRNAGSLEQRVQEFEKTAKYMIRKLEATKEKIEQCDEGEKVVEDIKFLIAPDAATLISQGDSLVLETHGKQSSISRLVMKTQIVLREKFREVQQAKSKVPLAIHQQQTGAPSPRSTLEKASIKGINVEELVVKGLKRINDLIDKPVDHKSSEDLERRLEEINDRRDDLKLIVNAIGRNIEMPKVNSNMMSEIEKTKNNLVAHADNIELSLSELQEKSNIVNENGSDDYNDISSGSGPLAFSFDKSVLQIADWLTWEQNMIKIQSVSVDDVDAVMMAIEKQEKVLRELKMKKPQLNELVHTAEVLKGDVKRQQLQEKVTRLREHWDETSQCVLQRAAQLKNMLGDSQRYEFKRLELEKWLARMEARAERMGTIATTADILEAQQKEQKSFHAELHQNKPQFEVFNALTQKLIAVYPSDDTSRIKKLTEAVNQRYSNLNNGVINRGKQLHAAVHSLQSFDRAMDQFLAFLSESESLCENAESEIDRNPLMFKKMTNKTEMVSETNKNEA